MNVETYVTSLIKQFNNKKIKSAENKEDITINSPWFGVLPFLLKWLRSQHKK